jgi:hypothetical protein
LTELEEDGKNVDMFTERSHCSDTKSNCSKEDGVEDLASEQGAKEEESDGDTTVVAEDETSNKFITAAEGKEVVDENKNNNKAINGDEAIDNEERGQEKILPDKKTSTSSMSLGSRGVSAPHDNKYELLSAGTMYMLWNDDSCHLECLKQTAGLRDEHQVLKLMQDLQDRAALLAGQGRGGEGWRNEREQTGSFITELGKPMYPDGQRDNGGQTTLTWG